MELVPFARLGEHQAGELRSLFEEAFPRSQREPFDELVERQAATPDRLLAMLDGDSVVALVSVSRLERVPWWFLEYFAVVRDRRDGGLGGRLWDAMMERLVRDGDDVRIIMEVEPPEDAEPASAERDVRERRCRFYARRGAVPLPIDGYHAPKLDGPGSVRMLLLAVPSPGELPPAGDDLPALVTALYAEGYDLDAGDPLVAAALR